MEPRRPWILICSALVMTLGLACAKLADSAWQSVVRFTPHESVQGELPAPPALTERLLFVLLDGVRLDASQDMETLRALAARGASGSLRVGVPSLSNPGRATLATGAWPEGHGVTNNGSFRPPTVESVISLAAKHGLPRTVFGSYFWSKAFGEFLGPDARRFDKELGDVGGAAPLIAWQQETCAEMVPFFAQRQRGLLIAGITASDEAGHDFGGESDVYREVVAASDRCLGDLVAALDDSSTTFVVTSDHGHIDRRGSGGHGGVEPEVMQVPLVLAGRGIRSSSGWKGLQVDVAPTLCALLGLPPPANSEGRAWVEALDLSASEEQTWNEIESKQQERLEARTPDRILIAANERNQRLPLALAAALLLLAAAGAPLYICRDRRTRFLTAIVVWYAVYAVLFRLFGLGYSLSDVVKEEYLNGFFARDMAAAVLALAAAALVLGELRRRAPFLALSLAALVSLQVVWVYAQSGLFAGELLPDIPAAFSAYLDLLAILALGLAGPVLSAGDALGRRWAP